MNTKNATGPVRAGSVKKTSLAKRNIEKLMRNKVAVAGFLIIAVIILSCVLAPLLTSWDPMGASLRTRGLPPSGEHLLGTDKLGRDVFSRLLYGGRYSILISLSGAIGGVGIGIILGCIAGYFGGWFDRLMVKVSEVFQSVPQIMLVLVLVVFLSQSITNLILIFVFTGWVGSFRMVRGRFFSLREENFVDSCKAFGIGSASIMYQHILPNTLGPVTVQITLACAGYILQEAALSFLGLGVPSDVPTWGNILNGAREVATVTKYPWIWLAPGIVISLFVLGVNFLGDGLRDVLDPNQ